MPIVAKDFGSDYERPDTGLHSAVCYGVWDLGTQMGFGGVLKHQVVVGWEIDQKVSSGDYAGKPMTVHKTYTLSLNEKANLAKDLESWRGRKFSDDERKEGFDLERLVGQRCMLNLVEVERQGKTYVNVNSVMAPTKDAEKLNPTLTPQDVPKFVQNKLADSGTINTDTKKGFEDDIPF